MDINSENMASDSNPSPNLSNSPLSNNSPTKPPRPRIVLPPTTPHTNIQTNPLYTASIPITPGSMSHAQIPFNLYPTKAGEFMFKQFNGFKDFTLNTAKSGMSFGEKILFWMYNKISSLSKRWFTHIFLGIVILLYSVGGAFLFVNIEGRHEEAIIKEMRDNRIEVLKQLREITLKPPQETTELEWQGDSYRALLEYEDKLMEYWSNKALYATNGERRKVWTFWNAIFYCGTIYTTIAQYSRTMGTLQASTDETKDDKEIKHEKPDKIEDGHRFEGKVTEEQELSASVARKRRTISKKRSESGHRPRDVTPARELLSEITNLDDDEIPKTPERKVKKTTSNNSNKSDNNDIKEDILQKQVKCDAETNTGTVVPIEAKTEDDKKPEQLKSSEEDHNIIPQDTPPNIEKEVNKNDNINITKKIIDETDNKKTEVNTIKEETQKNVSKKEASTELKPVMNKANESVEPVVPVRERPARMKRDKLIKKRSQSTPRPASEELGSKDDLQENIMKLKQEKELLETKLKTYRQTDINKKIILKQEKELVETKLKTDQQSDVDKNKKLIEDFKHAQILDAFGQGNAPEIPELISSESSSGSTEDKSGEEKTLRRRKPLQPAAQQFLERKKLEKVISQDEDDAKLVPVKLKRMTLTQLRANWKKFKTENPLECKRISNLRNKCLNGIGLIMIFCGFGGLIFKFTEGSFENFYKCGVKRVKRDFIEILWRGSHNLREEDWKSLARTKLKDFEEQLHTAHEAGVHSYSGQRSWSFLNGIVYALTIITTIGYGHMYPTTTTGRVLTIVYSIIGIPLFLIVLTDFGKLFTRCIKFVWAFVRRVYYTGTCKNARKTTAVKEVMKGAQMVYEIATFRRPSQYNIEEQDPKESPKFPTGNQNNSSSVTPHTDIEAPETPAPSNFEIDDEFNLPITVALTILILYIFSGALFYNFWEDWDFFASFYFVFISMSTIGFGDYVPKHPICMIASIVYLVFGLALMSMCINVVQLKLSDTFRQASAKLGATIGLRVAEEDGSITTIPPPVVEIADIHTNNTKNNV